MVVVGLFGANGFIGRHVTRALIARGLKTICFGRHFPKDFEEEFSETVQTRIVDLHNELEAHAKLTDVTHVIQLMNSSNAAMGNRHVISDIQTNLIPHVSFISSSIAAGVQSFTFISSGGTVYGWPEVVPISEDHPTLPLNSYGLTKLFTEQYLRMLSRDTDMGFNILRVANPFGPGQFGASGQGLIGTILQRHQQGLPVAIFGDGLNERDYLYVEDTADAIVRAVERPPLNDVLNIGSSVGRTILDVLSAIEAALGSRIAREHVADRATDARSNVLDASRAKRLLGWTTTTPFDEGIAKTVAWHLRHNVRR